MRTMVVRAAKPPLILVLGALLLVGCGPQAMPKGTGASGKVSVVVEKPKLGLELINKIEPKEAPRMEWLNQPFAKVILPGPAPFSAEERTKLEKRWSSIPVVNVATGQRYAYRARIVTSAGILTAQLSDNYTPNHVRNFVALVEEGFFDRTPLTLSEGVAFAGPPAEKSTYSIASETYPGYEPIVGTLLAVATDGKSPGTRFGLVVEKLQKFDSASLTLFGSVQEKADIKVIEGIAKKLKEKPGSVLIEKIEIARTSLPLFAASGELNLPHLGEDGRPNPQADAERAAKAGQ